MEKIIDKFCVQLTTNIRINCAYALKMYTKLQMDLSHSGSCTIFICLAVSAGPQATQTLRCVISSAPGPGLERPVRGDCRGDRCFVTRGCLSRPGGGGAI